MSSAASAAKRPPKLLATIHLGASSISMLVVNPAGKEEGEIELVDFFEQPVSLARDVFRAGRIGRAATERCVRILRSYRQALGELGVEGGTPNRIVCTNILAEAANQDIFLNRIHVACGLEVEPLDDGEMTRLIYMKTQRLIGTLKHLGRKRVLVLHVGPGNTRVLYFDRARIEHYSSYRLGTHRSHEAVQASDPHGDVLLSMLRENVRSSVDQICYDYGKFTIDEVLVIGYELQAIARKLFVGSDFSVPLRKLQGFVEATAHLSTDERVRTLQLDYSSADSVVPAALINLDLAGSFGVKSLTLPETDYERDLLADLPYSASLSQRFQDEVMQSALTLAARYQVHVQHARHVEGLCTSIFDASKTLHQLRLRDRLLLRVAAVLHETGNFITVKAHHKHSYYIIHHSEIFGLSQADIEMVALVARYHRHSSPKVAHTEYAELSREQRMVVSKLAAILRVADALDRSHSQRIRKLDIRVTDSKFIIGVSEVMDPAVEQLAMLSKADLFQNIFGLDVVIEPGRG